MQKTRMCTSPSPKILGADQACHLGSVCTLKAASQAPPVAGDLSKLFVTLYYDLTIINYAVRCTASSNQLSSSAPIRSAWIYFRQNLALSATLEVPTICAFVLNYSTRKSFDCLFYRCLLQRVDECLGHVVPTAVMVRCGRGWLLTTPSTL